MIPSDHVCYCEPFCGGAWILFGKEPSKVEVLNDLDIELVTFWRVVRHHLEEFLRYFKWAIVSRYMFDLANKEDPALMTDIQRAVRYYYLQRLGFGGRTERRSWGAGATKPTGLNLETINDVLLETHWRLQRVIIEHLDACACIRRYDRKTTFFYIDPPYHHVNQGYAHKYKDADFSDLKAALACMSGRFILSLNDTPAVRALFREYRIQRVSVRYSSGNTRQAADTRALLRHELIIANFRLRAARK
jgi:DNA adenine methylase